MFAAAGIALLAAEAAAAAPACSSPAAEFLNPFTSRSAHHRPIGTGARYAADDNPATLDWLQAESFAINVGGPWGVDVAETDLDDPPMEIGGRAVGEAKVVGLPVTIRMPSGGFDTLVRLGKRGNTDGVAIVYDRSTGVAHQLRQYNWNGGRPTAGQYRSWDIRGLGHGTRPGERVGTSASGVAGLFGLLRGPEINTPGHRIEHALQMVLPRLPGCNIMLSPDVVIPAVGRDGSAGKAGSNTGHIPYGALLALPPGVDLDHLELSEPGRRLAEAIRDYGIYAVDGGGCDNGALRADQNVYGAVLAQLKRDIPVFYPFIRMVLGNDVLGDPVAGGGTALAPNCAIDAQPEVNRAR